MVLGQPIQMTSIMSAVSCWKNGWWCVNLNTESSGINVLEQSLLRTAVEALMKRVKHPNLLSYYCYREDEISFDLLVSYFETTLHHFLSKRFPLQLPVLVAVGHQVAKGLDALHRNDLKHGNLNPDCVYLSFAYSSETEKLHVQLGGLEIAGVIRAADQLSPIIKKQQRDSYVAPEVLDDPFNFGANADMYSYGMLLWFLEKGVDPPMDVSQSLAAVQDWRHPDLYAIYEACASLDAASRPTSRRIIQQLCNLATEHPSTE